MHIRTVITPLALLSCILNSCATPLPSDDDGSSSTDATVGVDTQSSIDTSTGSSPDSTTTASTGTTEPDSTTAPAPGCGNDIAEPDEDCDGLDLAGGSCESLGFGGGTLACTAACAYDDSACGDLPAAPVLDLAFSPTKQFDFSWSAVPGADHYQLLESPTPGDPFVQLGDDIVGESISLTMPLHFCFEASYMLRACNAIGCTESAPASVVGSLAEAVGYFKASNTGSLDLFGNSVALSADGPPSPWALPTRTAMRSESTATR